jgi:hypothetical protein
MTKGKSYQRYSAEFKRMGLLKASWNSFTDALSLSNCASVADYEAACCPIIFYL